MLTAIIRCGAWGLGRESTPDPCQRASLQPIGFRLRWELPKEAQRLPCSLALVVVGLLANDVIGATTGGGSGTQRQRRPTISGILAGFATN